jgi:hypothetical protein
MHKTFFSLEEILFLQIAIKSKVMLSREQAVEACSILTR